MRRILFLALATIVFSASAQTIFKVQMPDGSIMFTDKPPPDGKILNQRDGSKASAPLTVAPPSPALSAQANAKAQDNLKRLESADADVRNAEQALALAKRRLELEREPLPDETQGIQKGGTRLTDAYAERIAALEKSVADAETRVKQAYDMKNGLR